jgi:hypothetical protein
MRRRPRRNADRIHHIRWCEVERKKGFVLDDARRLIRKLGADGKGMREYPCKHYDGLYHIGHLPGVVRAGQKTIQEWIKARDEEEQRRAERQRRTTERRSPTGGPRGHAGPAQTPD